MGYDKPTDPEIQKGFDLLFPEHSGHWLSESLCITDLSAPFKCSCGKTVRITVPKLLVELDGPSRGFLDYQKKIAEEFNRTFLRLSEESLKLGFVLVSVETMKETLKNLEKQS